jgi:hypothetical protein
MLYRLEKSSDMKNASASPQRSLRDRSGNRRVQELEEQSDVPSDSASPKRRQPQSTHELLGLSGQTKKASLTASTPRINESGSQCVDKWEKQLHVPENKESFNERQDHMEPTYVFHRDENNYIL